MKNVIITLLLMLVTLSNVNATNVWTGYKEIDHIQVVEHGGFLIYFTTDIAAQCTAAGTDTLYVYPDSAVSDSGVKAMLSTALLGLSAGMSVNVKYDNATSFCWGRAIVITN